MPGPLLKRFDDGCHRYGWLIHLLFTLIACSYFVGQVTQQVTFLHEENTRIREEIQEIRQVILRKVGP